MNAQEQVAENTRKRGYREGWTSEQFAARQVCKLVEELSELIMHIWASGELLSTFDNRWEILLDKAGKLARDHFDNRAGWQEPVVANPQFAKQELADIQVVVFNLAKALDEITNEPFDVVQAAVAKSESDIERGKR